LSALDRYAKEFPHGRLSTEALVVRIDALVRAGRSLEARSLGERFLSSYPSSPHGPRIKQLIGQ
jgi:outer membrane protein assembly factor BamD (BamD/ComL family)